MEALHWMAMHRTALYWMVLRWMVMKTENRSWYKEACPEYAAVPLGHDYPHPVCLFQPVNRDDRRLFPNIDLESLGSTLEDLEMAFIGSLQGHAVGVSTDENKFG